MIRRTLSFIAFAFVMLVVAAAPASAATSTPYPVLGGDGAVVEGTKTGANTQGSRTPTGVGGAGLARTGAELGTLYAGLALLVAGGVIVTISRNRRKVLA